MKSGARIRTSSLSSTVNPGRDADMIVGKMLRVDAQCLETTPRTRLHAESMERRTLSAELVEPAELCDARRAAELSDNRRAASRLPSTFPAPPRPTW